ncbi:MAG TPA: helix-turn-helix domain-containing protein [Candidatus Limnocylindrales bacterium]|nr:helix-turn-helix domain-containing protein [Candidatus Limnocylindrales bacterium]
MSTSKRIPAPGPTRTPRRRGAGAWLTIHEASALVGVSEATLRRWAEAGDVEAFVTPGGHRRFTRRAVLDLLPHPGRPHRTLRQLGGTPERVVRQYRRELTTTGATWLPQLDDAAREAFRAPGRQILTAILDFLDAPDEDAGAAALETACEAATAYGRLAAGRGLGIGTTAEAFLHFRSPFLEELATIARRRRLEASEAISLIIAAASVFDRLLPALLDGHLAAAEAAPGTSARATPRRDRGE